MDKAAAKKFLSKGKIHYKDLVSKKQGDSMKQLWKWLIPARECAVQSDFPTTISSVLQAV